MKNELPKALTTVHGTRQIPFFGASCFITGRGILRGAENSMGRRMIWSPQDGRTAFTGTHTYRAPCSFTGRNLGSVERRAL